MNGTYFLARTLALGISFFSSALCHAQGPGKDLPLQLTGYEVHLVRSNKPYAYRTDKNELKQAASAYLVFLNLKPELPVTNERIDFYIGDYKIPEYGGTRTGIYFRIYDPAILDRINNKPISWQYRDIPRTSFSGKPFIVESKKMKPETEETLLPRKAGG